MASEILFAGAGATGAPGNIAWTDPGNILADDANDATSDRVETDNTERLSSSTYGFTIPTGDTVDGIRVTMEINDGEGADLGFDLEAILLKAGSPVGNDKSKAASIPTAVTVLTYGSPTDLWGTTWTPAEINATGFGFAYRMEERGAGRSEVFVNYHRIEVFHTAAGGGLSIPVAMQGYRQRRVNN